MLTFIFGYELEKFKNVLVKNKVTKKCETRENSLDLKMTQNAFTHAMRKPENKSYIWFVLMSSFSTRSFVGLWCICFDFRYHMRWCHCLFLKNFNVRF